MGAIKQRQPRTTFLDAVNQVAEILRTQSDADITLRKLAEVVRDYMGATGAKVIVVRRGTSAACLEQLSRTDLETIEDLKKLRDRALEISHEEGLADWVVVHNAWLLIPAVPPQDPGQDLEPMRAQTARGDQFITPRRESAFFEGIEDKEKTLLMIPLLKGVKAAGVLGVWRDEALPFQEAKDTKALKDIAPFVAAACRQVLQQRALQDELEAVSKLAADLHEAKTLSAAYGSVAEGVAKLSIAPHAILLHHDPDRPGNLYHRITWSDNKPEGSSIEKTFKGLYIDCGEDTTTWMPNVLTKVSACLGQHDNLKVQRDRVFRMEVQGVELPRLVIVLLDHDRLIENATFFADDFRKQAAESFLSYADSLLQHHIQTYPRRVLEAIAAREQQAKWEPDGILGNAATVLQEATGASGALVYSGTGPGMKVTRTSPYCAALVGAGVTKPSVTLKSIETNEIQRVVDLIDPKESLGNQLDHHQLQRFRKEFGWRQLRSWLACPIIERGRCIGVLKLMTADEDSFLGKDHEQVAEAVAEWAAGEIQKSNRRLMLEKLNELANTLTREVGDALSTKLVSALEEWVDHFVRPKTRVVVVGRMSANRPLIRRGSTEFSTDFLEGLDSLSASWGQEPREWTAKAILRAGGPNSLKMESNLAGVATPFRLPLSSYLQGHLIFMDEKPFTSAERDAAAEAAREIGLILNSERLRRQWVEAVGRFRHAVLGPVQGLTSRAKALALRLEANQQSDPWIRRLLGQIEEEAEVVRLWRYNQRLYLTEKVSVVKHSNSLKKVFDRCLERFRPIFAARDIPLKGDWEPKGGELRFLFDEMAIDLALSNLLDNARKYAFFHQPVALGVRSESSIISIWVEDIGHPIPARLAEAIYQKEQRMDWQDPLRTIEGEGLGLPMVGAIIDAHDGKLFHTCEKLSADAHHDRAPYRVRFTIELPTFWGR